MGVPGGGDRPQASDSMLAKVMNAIAKGYSKYDMWPSLGSARCRVRHTRVV